MAGPAITPPRPARTVPGAAGSGRCCASDWLLRVTPAAAFAVQGTAVRYPQVANVYTPQHGYFPLAPWAGFGVLCLWAAAAFGLATVLLRRRDA